MTTDINYALRAAPDILTKIEAVKPGDIMGFQQSILIAALPLDDVKPFLSETWEATDETWPEPTAQTVLEEASDYLTFAYGKAESHRGISATRSIQKMQMYCWLLGDDTDCVGRADFAMYGVPGLRAASEFLKHPAPVSAKLDRMARGEMCEPGCVEGCAE